MTADQLMEKAEELTAKVLSISENFRHCPTKSLARALFYAGTIGTPTVAWEFSLGSAYRDVMHCVFWRSRGRKHGIRFYLRNRIVVS